MNRVLHRIQLTGPSIVDLAVLVDYEDPKDQPDHGTWEGHFQLGRETSRTKFEGTWSTVIGMGNCPFIKVECKDPKMTWGRCHAVATLIQETMGIYVSFSEHFDPA